ncbi:MAG: O-antigen ligase family protein [Chlorobi bacterium]|nr:O-antigen ligase family protein [Chlorobiota bacterium]
MAPAKKEITLFYLISLLFLAFSAGMILLHASFVILLIPAALLLAYFAFFSLDVFFLVTVALVPLSVPLQIITPNLGFDLSLPAEPLMIFILLLLVMKGLREPLFPAALLRHPLTLIIMIYLSWMFVTAVTSTMPLVSFKYFLAHLWFIASAYFLGFLLFSKTKNIYLFLLVYILPLVLVILYAFYNQSLAGFINQKAAHSAMRPFYNDHTAYGAILAMFIPVIAGFLSLPKQSRPVSSTASFLLLLLFLTALLFSYSRAAWISVAGMFVVFILIWFRVRVEIIVTGIGILIVAFFIFQSSIWIKLQENRQESSTSLAKHLESVANVRSDASNMERILRWKCALDMFAEKPLTGWGPGTYMFQYAPFQRSYDRTIISTNFGDRGNAHSEYLGPLSETGWPGLLSVFLILVFALHTGIRTYLRTHDRETGILSLAITLGLVTYFIHGLLNNFLDTDKASVPFWGFMAILVALDLKTRDQREKEQPHTI